MRSVERFENQKNWELGKIVDFQGGPISKR
jgi:hypothetical protein